MTDETGGGETNVRPQPDCFVCKSPFDQHNWHSVTLGLCPGVSIWKIRGVYAGTYWPEAPDGERAVSWEPHPVLSPIEQLLVNNIETIREVLDDWLSLLHDTKGEQYGIHAPWFAHLTDADLAERAHTLRREIAELTGELADSQP